jgi:hypothetical protein
MRTKLVFAFVVTAVLGFGIGVLYAGIGTTDSTGPPDDPASESYTLEDLYNRLTTGAAGSQTTFTEPSSGPGTGTMHTLNEIMAEAPSQDNADGATTGDVLEGRTFWGLRTDGTWGLQTGTLDPRQDLDNDCVVDIADDCPGSPEIGDLCWSVLPFGSRTCVEYYELEDRDCDGCFEAVGRRGEVPGCNESTPICPFGPV